jgi:hypothetical protein
MDKMETVRKHFGIVKDRIDDLLGSHPSRINDYYYSILEHIDYLSSVLECSNQTLYLIQNNVIPIKLIFTELKERKLVSNQNYRNIVFQAKAKLTNITFPEKFDKEPSTFRLLDEL